MCDYWHSRQCTGQALWYCAMMKKQGSEMLTCACCSKTLIRVLFMRNLHAMSLDDCVMIPSFVGVRLFDLIFLGCLTTDD